MAEADMRHYRLASYLTIRRSEAARRRSNSTSAPSARPRRFRDAWRRTASGSCTRISGIRGSFGAYVGRLSRSIAAVGDRRAVGVTLHLAVDDADQWW